MVSTFRVETRAKPGGTTPSGKAYAVIEFRFLDHPELAEWKKTPGYVIADDAETALTQAEGIALDLCGVPLDEMDRAHRRHFTDEHSPMQRNLA